jgi:flagellar biosynthesis/type III secretory pathway M-ring protein FliF/YscJ
MQNQSLDIPLHDIKPLVEVSDNSFFIFMLLVIVALLLLMGVGYLLVHFLRHRKRDSSRKDAYAKLKQINFSDAKAAAYGITKYGRTFAQDSPRTKETYDNLVSRLAPYKYKKEVDAIDAETKSYYEIYVGMIDV